MSAPIRVEIARPKRETSEVVSAALTHIIALFADAFVLMLLAPHFSPWHPSYGAAFAAVFVLQTLIPARSPDYGLWTTKAAKRARTRRPGGQS